MVVFVLGLILPVLNQRLWNTIIFPILPQTMTLTFRVQVPRKVKGVFNVALFNLDNPKENQSLVIEQLAVVHVQLVTSRQEFLQVMNRSNRDVFVLHTINQV